MSECVFAGLGGSHGRNGGGDEKSGIGVMLALLYCFL